MRRMIKTLATWTTVLMLATGVSGQHDDKAGDAKTLTGTWNMGLQGGHVIPVALVLEQKGTLLTGTLTMPTQNAGQTVDVALKGEFANAALSIAGTVEGAPIRPACPTRSRHTCG
jgi:hypothetical protein